MIDFGQDTPHLRGLGEALLAARPQEETRNPQEMPERSLIQIIQEKVQNSHQWYGTGALASQRIEADKYYRGEPRGDEIEGRSQVVSRDVAESVDSMMPSLMRIFAGGDQVVIMEPSRQDAEDDAEQATDYLNWLFLQQNEGFQVLYTWFKDALLKRNGVVMAWHETRISRQRDSYEGLTEQQFQIIQNDPAYEVVDSSSYPDPYAPPAPQQPVIDQSGMPLIDPMTGQMAMQPPPPPPMLFDCAIIASKPVKKIVIENVPPDEFIIEKRAVSLETAGFLGRRRKMAVSDLIELGFDRDTVMNIPRSEESEYSQEKLERFREENTMPGIEGESIDKTMRKVWITEAYLRVDYDGDGIAEWRKVVVAGEGTVVSGAILSNEEIDDHPFSSLTPYPDPHRFYGYGIFDQTKDIQDIKTALLRGALDSIYLANQPRLGVVDGQVNVDDLLDARAGGIIRMKNPNALVPVATVMAAPQAFQMVEYMDATRANRTGVSPGTAGLDPNILNSSATGANILDNNQQQRLELIARVFAETGIKRLFRRIFELVCTNSDKAQTVKLRGKWVDIDPTQWKSRMDVTVSVGIGLGSKSQAMAQAMGMLSLDERIVALQGGVQGPLLNAKNIYNKLAKVIQAAGWKSIEPYYTDPDTVPPPPPAPPDPTIEIEHMRVQTEQMKLQKMAAKEQSDSQQVMFQADIQMRIAELESQTKIAVAQIQADAAMANKRLEQGVIAALEKEFSSEGLNG